MYDYVLYVVVVMTEHHYNQTACTRRAQTDVNCMTAGKDHIFAKNNSGVLEYGCGNNFADYLK